MYIKKSPQKQLKHESPHILLVSQISRCSSKSSFKAHVCGTCCIMFQICTPPAVLCYYRLLRSSFPAAP